MKVIIAGSRNIKLYQTVVDGINLAIKEWGIVTEDIHEVISGGAIGPDQFGEQWAKLNGIPIVILAASWQLQGKAAGPIRNQEMANRADALIAIWDGKSRGTRDMINKANRRGLKVYVHTVEAG